MKITFEEYKQMISANIGSSRWLRKAIDELDKRDVVDAINDLEYLVEVFDRKLVEYYSETVK